MKNSASLVYSVVLLVADFVALIAAFTLAFIVRVRIDDRPLIDPITAEQYIGLVAVLLVFWVFVYSLLGLYRPQVYENRFKEAAMLLVGSFIGILFLIGAEYVLDRPIFPARLVTVYGFLFAFLLTLLFRTVVRAVRNAMFLYGKGVNQVLLVGSSDINDELARHFSHPKSGYKIVGVIGDKRTKYQNIDEKLQYSNFAEAAKVINSADINSIVQTELFSHEEQNNEILAFAQENHIAYRFVPGNNRLFVGNIDVNLFENIPTISVHQTALVGWGRIVKRVFDFFVSLFLLIVFSPLMLIIWLAIKIVDPGPALYKEKRLTRYNTEFNVLKFRTFRMKTNGLPVDEAYELLGEKKLAERYRKGEDTLPIDPLLHPLGKFLRATSLDELPQLINVVRGDLSMVGPRPLVTRELEHYSKKNLILSVKPGITGLAVVSGRREIPFEERRKLDMYYVQNWSFTSDIVILLKTFLQVIARAFSGKSE